MWGTDGRWLDWDAQVTVSANIDPLCHMPVTNTCGMPVTPQ